MKKSFVFIVIIFIGILIFKNQYEKETNASIKAKHQKFIKNHPLQNNLKLSKQERLDFGIPPNKYLEQLYLLQINPHTGRTHPENIYKVQQDLKKQRKLQRRSPGDAIDNQWTERGPNNVGGRTRVVMFDPNDPTHKRVFAGGVSGGLWVNDDITDVNSSWTNVGIEENLSVTCMAVDPNNSQIMYLGTGELYQPQHALGNGIWKSTDGGVTWNNIYNIRGTTTVSGSIEVPGTYFMTDIIVRDKDGNTATTNDSEVFAAIGASFYSSNPINTNVGKNSYGIYKSTDEGANWTKITLDVNGNSVAPNDFELDVNNTLWMSTTRNVFGDGGGQIYSSTDGASFILKHTIPNGRRTEIAVSKSNANSVYVLGEVYTVDGSNNEISPFLSILKTTDAFATTPTAISLPNDATSNISADDFTRGQAFYDLVIEVDPNNDAIVYVGGINLFRTANSGTSWEQLSKNTISGTLPAITVSYVHPDQHSWAFHPTNSNIAVIGNDGGVFYASSLSAAANSSTAIEERTKDYNTTQFYNAAISQTTSPEYIVGGTQDNGVLFFNEATSSINSATIPLTGDGGHCFIDKDGGYMIVSKLYNNIYRYDLPYTGSVVTIASDSNTGNFFNARALDENLDILYSNGNTHLARFTDITTNSPVRFNITNPLISNISAIKVSPYTTTSSKVFVGTRAGKVIKVDNANTATPTFTDISSSSFLGNISSIEFGATEDEIMVTFYNFGVESIWFTTDGGINWSTKEGDFPDINVRCILMNPLNTNQVIVGSELGVWNTNNFRDASPNWEQSYNGMSDATVTSFSLRTSDNTVLASTFGRGLFTGKFTGNVLTTWIGAENDSDWTKLGNWSHGVPTASMDVKIPKTTFKPEINAAITVANLSIEKDASLTINAASSLTVSENLTNNGALTINSTLANSGSLMVEGNSSGNIIYNRFVGTNWHLISSPVINQVYDNDWVLANSIASGTENTNQRGIAKYNNNSGSWNYMLAGESATFNKAEGYSTLRTTSGNLSFEGNLLTNDTTKVISNGTANSFNLVGNVYASYIPLNTNADATHNFLDTNVAALEELTAWFWNGNSYVPYNHTSNSQFIAPGQAFFVKSKTGSNLISFTKEMQQHQNTTAFQKQPLKPTINIFLSTKNNKKYSTIYYLKQATKGFDNGYDSTIYSGLSSNFEVYTSLVSNEKELNLAIQSIPEEYTTIIPIGIIAEANKEHAIYISSKNIEKGKNIYLEDKKLGVFTLMNNTKTTYKFTSDKPINGLGRFYLHTTTEVLDVRNNTLSSFKLYYADDKIHFSELPSGKKTIKIYNLIGKLLFEESLVSQSIISVRNLPKTVYIVQIKTENETIKKKIIVK
ncbi:T9SS type A sorting domain-containing protein [Polaribacter aestuariivivens]|uniref:T9SS type A sorting domain-containing protein n=1 Tax=Polaribacter aestuariivivens TaxID=2304626 RepID=UPI003F49A4D1